MALQANSTANTTINRIHLIAVCGTAMGALASMLKEMGYIVTGSDQHIYPPMSDFLQARNIPIHAGFRAENLEPRPDLVVVGNAVSRDNPEVQAMHALELPYCSMPEAINRFAAAGKKQIVVTGTHGKTTTSSFMAWMLQSAGLDPSFIIGGLVGNFQSNYRVGSGPWIVLEGDEYDTAYFDKGPKFLHYRPTAAVITSIEFDHADIFADLQAVKDAFAKLIRGLDRDCLIAAFDSDDVIRELVPQAQGKVVTYGRQEGSAWRLGRVCIEPPFTRFEVLDQGRLLGSFKTRMIGEHNLWNLLAGIAVGRSIGLSTDTIAEALETFKGVRRRQEVRGVKNDIIVLDDFAHHPTAVALTVEAVRNFYRGQRVIAVFEPRTNSSRRKVFQSVYPQALQHADLICIRQAPLLEKVPEDQRFSSQQLVADLKALGKQAHFFETTDSILDFLIQNARPLDVILIMSNGGFDNIHTRLLQRL